MSGVCSQALGSRQFECCEPSSTARPQANKHQPPTTKSRCEACCVIFTRCHSILQNTTTSFFFPLNVFCSCGVAISLNARNSHTKCYRSHPQRTHHPHLLIVSVIHYRLRGSRQASDLTCDAYLRPRLATSDWGLADTTPQTEKHTEWIVCQGLISIPILANKLTRPEHYMLSFS